MNILLLNLTRFGDLLQSAAAVRALAEGNGGEKHRIGIVCLENFTAGAELLANVMAIYPLPSAKITALCMADASRGNTRERCNPATWLKGLSCLHEWIKTIQTDFAPDVVYNLSPSTSSSLLGRLLADSRDFRGFTLDELGFSHTTSPWAAFIQGASAARMTNPFNIVDLFRKVVCPNSARSDASLLPVPEPAVSAIRGRLLSLRPESPTGFVCLQLGASADIRRWPVKFFAAVGDALWKTHNMFPVLLGTKQEIPLSEEYAAHASGPFVSLIGQTDLTELAAALTLSSLCISNDTGTLHLASGLGTPVLGIYLATAQSWDTGPYAAGNCSLEPDLPCHPCDFGTSCPNAYACHTAIQPETVLALASAKLHTGKWNTANFSYPQAPGGARIWESASDEYHFTDIISLSRHEHQSRTQWMRVQRHLYRQFFDKNTANPFEPTPYTTPLTLDSETAFTLAQTCDETLSLFDALLQQADMLVQKPLPLVKDRFSRTWQRLAAVLHSQPAFAAVAFNWQTEALRQGSVEDTVFLARQYRNFFSFLRNTLQ